MTWLIWVTTFVIGYECIIPAAGIDNIVYGSPVPPLQKNKLGRTPIISSNLAFYPYGQLWSKWIVMEQSKEGNPWNFCMVATRSICQLLLVQHFNDDLRPNLLLFVSPWQTWWLRSCQRWKQVQQHHVLLLSFCVWLYLTLIFIQIFSFVQYVHS